MSEFMDTVIVVGIMFGLAFMVGLVFRARVLAVLVATLLALVCLTVVPAVLGILASQSMAGVWR